MGKKQSDVAKTSLHRYIMGGLALLIVVIGTWLVFEVRRHEANHIRSELMRQASSVASTLSMENMRDLSFRAEDTELPAYQRIASQLQIYSQAMGIHRLYTLSLRDGQLLFGPGGHLADGPYAVPPGTIHQKPSPAEWEAFRSGESGIAELHSDEFGEVISALVPIVDSLSGEVLLLVGLDIEASAFRQRLIEAQRVPFVSSLALLAVVLLGYLLHGVYKRSPNMRVEWLRNIQISIYFTLMLLVTVIAFVSMREIQNTANEELFETEANSRAYHFAEATEQIDLVLHMLIGFFESSEHITREEFSSFCRHIFEGYPINACFWLPELSDASAPAFTARMQEEGLPDFTIRRFADDNRPKQNPSDPIYPAVYIEPASRLPTTLGYDFYSHPILRKTLVETLRSGSDHACMVSAPTSTNTEPAGFFVFVPISDTRQGGMICFSVNLDALVKGSLSPNNPGEISTTLFQLFPGRKPLPLVCSSCDQCDDMLEARLSERAPLFAFGNTYMMLFTAAPQWFAINDQHTARWMLGIGLLLTLLLTYMTAVLINRPLLLEKQVVIRTRELAESKERYDIAISAAQLGVWELDIATARLTWNDRMLEIYGIQEDRVELSAQKWSEYVHPEDHNRFMREITGAEYNGKALNTEFRIVRPDGEIRHVSAFGRLTCDPSGRAEQMIGVNLDITEQKQSELALEESRQLLCNIIDTLPERVWWKDLDSRYLGCNIHVAHDAGFDHPDQLIGKTDFDMCWAVHAEAFIATDREVIKSGIPRLFDPELQVMEDGSSRWIEVSMIPLKDGNGKIFGVLGTYTDITERMQTELALKENKDRLSRAQQVAQVGDWEFDLANNIANASDEAKRIYGLEERHWTVSEIQTVPLKKHRAKLDKALDELINQGKPYDVEFTIKRPSDGTLREIHSVAEYDSDRKLVFGVIQDVTERKQAELSLARSEAKYRDLFEQSADAFLIIKENRFIDCNQAAVDMLRCTHKKELLDTHPSDLSPERQPDGRMSREKAEELMHRVREEKTLRFEWLHKRADGDVFPVEVTLTSITDSEGAHIIHTSWRDIADRKRAEEKLTLLSTAMEQSPESIVITDTNGCIEYINPAFEKTTGYEAAETIGQNPRMLQSGEHSGSFYEEMWKTLASGNIWEGRITNKRKDGTFFTEESSISPVTDADGQTVNYVAVKRDITAELIKEEELRQAQKMEAVGELAGGVAHDFNNILQGIIGFSELLRYSLDETSLEYANVTEIHKSANKAAKLTQQLLTFSRKQAVQLTETDLNDVVYDTEALLSVLLSDQHEIVLDLADELPAVYADQGQLTQIIMNLAVNARDAMPEGGRLSISTDSILISEADAVHISGARPGRYLCLAVTDTGAGMDDEMTTRIFDPFFTTKDVGFGTGLGLAVIYGIVEQNNGWINVYSEIGKGSCFKIYLPVSASNGDAAEADPAADRQGPGSRILVVDDEQKILTMVKKVLEEENFIVTAAESAEEGLALFDQDPEGFDLLMSDMILPGMRGDELAEALRMKIPELPVLLFSGYRDQSNRWRQLATKGFLFINKPFTIELLLDAVRDTLKDTRGTHG